MAQLSIDIYRAGGEGYLEPDVGRRLLELVRTLRPDLRERELDPRPFNNERVASVLTAEDAFISVSIDVSSISIEFRDGLTREQCATAVNEAVSRQGHGSMIRRFRQGHGATFRQGHGATRGVGAGEFARVMGPAIARVMGPAFARAMGPVGS